MTLATSLDDLRRKLGASYTIERELGKGGMGAVFLARDLRLDRPVALKVLPPDLAADPGLRERFLRETRTAASFSHPNIVPVHAVVEQEGLVAFAMGYVEGESLGERVRRAGPLDVRATVRLLQDIGYALAYAHGRGVVHRDIKPDNIMLERATGRALLMDFGISRTITAPVDTRGLTRVGEVVGSPEYMSPEQASGDVVDGRSDIYALGLVALFALTGNPAITGDSTQKILVKQLTELPPAAALLRPDLPESLAAAIDRCVAKHPEERFPTAEALVEAIDSARLMAPEIPITIRLFAEEAATLGLILLFVAVISWLAFQMAIAQHVSGLDALLPVVLLFAVVLTRILQTFAAARRLAIAGFGPEETLKGLRAVGEERDVIRRQLHADPAARQRRRRTLIVAAVQLAFAVLFLRLALLFRVQVGPHSYTSGPGTVALVIGGILLLGTSFVFFVRSPFSRPAGERVFRLVWLGPIGRGFLRLAARGTGTTSGITRTTGARPVVPVVRPAPVPGSSAPTAGEDSMGKIEARVAALERWRDSTDRR